MKESSERKHPELLHAVVDAALVLVDVGPSVTGGAKGGDIAPGGLRDALEPHEQTHGCLPVNTHSSQHSVRFRG